MLSIGVSLIEWDEGELFRTDCDNIVYFPATTATSVLIFFLRKIRNKALFFFCEWIRLDIRLGALESVYEIRCIRLGVLD